MAAPSHTTADQHDSQQLLIIVVSILLTLVTLVGISLRIYARLRLLGKLFTDDVLMLFGTITACGLSATFTIGAYHGYGQHASQLTEADQEVLRKIAFAIIFLYIVTQLLVKTSFLVLYLRLDQRAPMRATVYILMFVVAAQNITFFIVQALSCIPIGSIDAGHCWSSERMQLLFNVTGIIITIIDTAIFVIPLCMLHGLELPIRQKFAVGALFALAFLPLAAGSLRCFYTWHAIASNDISYNLSFGGIFAQLEIHLAILCGSASTFKVLLKGFWPWRWWCQNDEETLPDSFANRQSRAVELPTPWLTDQLKFEDVSFSESPVSTEGSWRSWTPPLPPVMEEEEMRECIAPRLSKSMPKRKENEVARLPADLQLRFPSVEARLGGRHAWMEEATGVKKKETPGKRWSLIQSHRC